MYLDWLEVRHFRNLTSVSLSPSPALNIIEGANASGKTSFLEAIHILGIARSFRCANPDILIQNGSSDFTLFTHVSSPSSHHRVGYQRSRGGDFRIRIDGTNAKSTAELATLLPLQLITPDSITLVTGSPSERRSYLDWLMFHVEHDFHHTWSSYQKVVRQRNALLRRGDTSTLSYWSELLIQTGMKIHEQRIALIERLKPHITHFVQQLLPASDFSLSYRQGWNRSLTLEQALAENQETDTKMKFTGVGPHRADLVFKDSGKKVVDTLSRGQLKLLVCALKLAVMAFYKQLSGGTPIVLIDDLPAELDAQHRYLLLNLLEHLQTQVFVTTTSRSLIDVEDWSRVKMFHVEHGVFEEVV